MCTREQAILLASYAVQCQSSLNMMLYDIYCIVFEAEFGDHVSENHTVDFFAEYVLFPTVSHFQCSRALVCDRDDFVWQ